MANRRPRIGAHVRCPEDLGSPAFQGRIIRIDPIPSTNVDGTRYLWCHVKRLDGAPAGVWPSHRLGYTLPTMKTTAKSQEPAPYSVQPQDDIVARALAYLESTLRNTAHADQFSAPAKVKDYFVLRMARLEREVFSVLFLDGQHKLIACEDLFLGTLTVTSVYPREIIKRALALNAGAVVFAHNHPSGSPEPSRADEHLTNTLKHALSLVDVRVLDHIVVGGTSTVSLTERGLM